VNSLRLTLSRAPKGARRAGDQNPSAYAFFAHALTFVLCGLPTATSNLQSPTSRVLRHVGPSKLASILLGSLAEASMDLQAEQRHNKTQTPVLKVRSIAPKSSGSLILLHPAFSVRFSTSRSLLGPRPRRRLEADPMTAFDPRRMARLGSDAGAKSLKTRLELSKSTRYTKRQSSLAKSLKTKDRTIFYPQQKCAFLGCAVGAQVARFVSLVGAPLAAPGCRGETQAPAGSSASSSTRAKRGMRLCDVPLRPLRLCGGRAVPDALHP
jgi:hypothetical protein